MGFEAASLSPLSTMIRCGSPWRALRSCMSGMAWRSCRAWRVCQPDGKSGIERMVNVVTDLEGMAMEGLVMEITVAY